VVGDKEHKLPDSEIAKGGSAGPDPPCVRRRTPSEQGVHHVEPPLGLVTLGMNQRSNGCYSGEKQRNASATEAQRTQRRKDATVEESVNAQLLAVE
jgi:hypothetical protein